MIPNEFLLDLLGKLTNLLLRPPLRLGKLVDALFYAALRFGETPYV